MMPATGDHGSYCPALVRLGDRKAHEDCCAYRPMATNMVDSKQTSWPNVPTVNVDQVVTTLKCNLARFERVLADRMDLFIVQVRSILEEQNLQRLRSGASGAMTNFKYVNIPFQRIGAK